MEVVSIGKVAKCFFDLISGNVRKRKEQVYIPCRDKFIEIKTKYFQNQASYINEDFENDLSDIEYKILDSDIKKKEKQRLQDKLNLMKNRNCFTDGNKKHIRQMIAYFNHKIENCSIVKHIKSVSVLAIKGLLGFVFYCLVFIFILHCMKIKITYFMGQNSVRNIEFINDIPSLILFVFMIIIVLCLFIIFYIKKYDKSIDDYWENDL